MIEYHATIKIYSYTYGYKYHKHLKMQECTVYVQL